MRSICRLLAPTLLLLLPCAAMAGDGAELGARIAAQGTPDGVAPCTSCHMPDGAGIAAAGFPRIAGMNADYMARQLRDFAGGQRQNPTMMPVAKALTAPEIVAVADYYAGLPVPPVATEAAGSAGTEAAAELARVGDWSKRSLPACTQCHGSGGNGIGAAFPGIAGQHASYIKAQLLAWRAGSRANDPLGMMQTVAVALSEAEIDALAAYYAAQPAGPPAGAAMGTSAATAGTEVSAEEIHSGPLPRHDAPPAAREVDERGHFEPPLPSAIPDDRFGAAVRQGLDIFENTNAHPVSARFVGNEQACGNCHIDAGRLADSAPLWAAWVAYPAYRTKNDKVNTYIERVQGCFKYSMNAQASAAGAPPAADSDTIVSLVAYSYWLATGAPTGDHRMPGRGYPRLKEAAEKPDAGRGKALYAQQCAICHGGEGQGVLDSDGVTLFPPLWGAVAYNWGAGMHRVDTAAAFIRHNMPLGLGDTLTEQEAWDLAQFINSHERPQDPRFAGDLEETAREFHSNPFSLYGKPGLDGGLLGSKPSAK